MEVDALDEATPVGSDGRFDSGVMGTTGDDCAIGAGSENLGWSGFAGDRFGLGDVEDGAAVGDWFAGAGEDDALGNAEAGAVDAVEAPGADAGGGLERGSELGGGDAGASPCVVVTVAGAPFELASGSR